jgi:hypothetical protein
MRAKWGETDLIRTGDNLWELAFLLILALDHRFYDGGVVRSQVHEAVGYSGLREVGQFQLLESHRRPSRCRIEEYWGSEE